MKIRYINHKDDVGKHSQKDKDRLVYLFNLKKDLVRGILALKSAFSVIDQMCPTRNYQQRHCSETLVY